MERFLAKVDQTGDCWVWTSPTVTKGYGLFWFEGRMERAHRFAYRFFVGPIPAGRELDHLCHTRDLSCPGGDACPHRRCVRPDHLEPVDHRTNMIRGRNSGRRVGQSFGVKDTLTHCPQDHEYTPENIYEAPSGRLECRECRSARKQGKRPRSESLPSVCLNALGALGGNGTATQVLQQLRAQGRSADLYRVTTSLGRLSARELPLVARTYRGSRGGQYDASAWEVTDAGRVLLARD
jgi:hypothetical protein